MDNPGRNVSFLESGPPRTRRRSCDEPRRGGVGSPPPRPGAVDRVVAAVIFHRDVCITCAAVSIGLAVGLMTSWMWVLS